MDLVIKPRREPTRSCRSACTSLFGVLQLKIGRFSRLQPFATFSDHWNSNPDQIKQEFNLSFVTTPYHGRSSHVTYPSKASGAIVEYPRWWATIHMHHFVTMGFSRWLILTLMGVLHDLLSWHVTLICGRGYHICHGAYLRAHSFTSHTIAVAPTFDIAFVLLHPPCCSCCSCTNHRRRLWRQHQQCLCSF